MHAYDQHTLDENTGVDHGMMTPHMKMKIHTAHIRSQYVAAAKYHESMHERATSALTKLERTGLAKVLCTPQTAALKDLEALEGPATFSSRHDFLLLKHINKYRAINRNNRLTEKIKSASRKRITPHWKKKQQPDRNSPNNILENMDLLQLTIIHNTNIHSPTLLQLLKCGNLLA